MRQAVESKLVGSPGSLLPASLWCWAPALGSWVWYRWFTSIQRDLPDSLSFVWTGTNYNAIFKVKRSTALLRLCSIKITNPKPTLWLLVKSSSRWKLKNDWIYFHKQPRSNVKPWAGIKDPERQSYVLKDTQLECNPKMFNILWFNYLFPAG